MEADEDLELLCQVCAKRATVPCRCAAIYFCSDAHRSVFSSSHPDADCARFAEQLRRGAPALDSLLESVVGESRSPRDACAVLREAGVHGRGLFASCCPCGGGGGGGGVSCWPALPTSPAAALPSLASLLLLPEGEGESPGQPLLQLRPLTSPPKDWREYLVARGLLRPPQTSPSASPPPSSSASSSPPVAPATASAMAAAAAAAMTLLHRPLTASLALGAAGWWSAEGGERGKDDDENDDDENEDDNGPPRPFVLHVAGASVDAEVAQWPSWLELTALGGGERPRRKDRRSLAVTLVGPTVPASLDGASAAFSSRSADAAGFNITISFARGSYHDVVGSLEEADAVFAPDAGVGADFEGWKKTILSWTRPPRSSNNTSSRSPLPLIPPVVLVTDLTEEAALLSVAAARKVLADDAADDDDDETGRGGRGGGKRSFRVTDPELNPFRSPARVRAPGGTALPAAAGGWAFWILEEREEQL